MRTLGIDLAAQADNTALCVIDWTSQRAHVATPVVGVDDQSVLAEMRDVDWTGIDAPFGWPEMMVNAVQQYANAWPWPADEQAKGLRYRATDLFTHRLIESEHGVSVWPLSVSSDRIAVCAWRCARLLSLHAVETGRDLKRMRASGTKADRTAGETRTPDSAIDGGVVEVYPAGALACWGMPYKRYKSTRASTVNAARTVRAEIIAGLEQASSAWLDIDSDARDACLQSDHCLDALISSFIARATATGGTYAPPLDGRAAAEREGWIQLPKPETLARLGTDTT